MRCTFPKNSPFPVLIKDNDAEYTVAVYDQLVELVTPMLSAPNDLGQAITVIDSVANMCTAWDNIGTDLTMTAKKTFENVLHQTLDELFNLHSHRRDPAYSNDFEKLRGEAKSLEKMVTHLHLILDAIIIYVRHRHNR